MPAPFDVTKLPASCKKLDQCNSPYSDWQKETFVKCASDWLKPGPGLNL